MTRRETVINALLHKETEHIPYHADFTEQEYERVSAFVGDKDFIEKYGCYLHYWQYWAYPTEREERPGYFTDGFGVTWNRTGADKDIGIVDEPVISEADISLYPTPFLDEKRIREDCERLIATRGDRFCFAGIGFSMFERLWSYVGMEDALVYMITEPEFVHELLDKILEFNLRVIDIINEYPFDAVYFGDDWGQQRGMIMGAPLWREFIKPRMKIMYERVKKDGKFVIQHSCGDIQDVFEDLIEIGLDCYQTVQPEIYDLKEIKERFGERLTFWGAVSTQRDLVRSTPDELRRIIDDTVSIMKKGGGYILAPTHALPQDVPPENVIAMLEHFKTV
ncbi:MAG: uroporphyrinogen decarboxylase [Ruminococcaceae bacterium]|nr:uroporphyrinogen decarboxylase [Oscillospiraceae bacterium]